jgi:cell division septation protein DedD
MAKGSRRGGDIVLGVRHIAGVFAVLVVLLGVMFTLGYVLGRGHYDAQSRAAAENALPTGAGAASQERLPPPAAELEFYNSAEQRQTPERLSAPAEAKPVPAPKPVASRQAQPPQPPRSATTPLMPRGATVLQVAALTRESDALAMAHELREKDFPAFVLSPTADRYYRVQVGPYPDAASATAARRKLEGHGFKPIVRR